jgi:predicted restriction endonuclease
MCFARDNWQCQICGKEVEEVTLHCHHIEGYTQNPLLGNDIDNVITLCKEHHKEIHKLPGCEYYELRCIKESI